MIFVLGLGITASSKILYDGGDFNEISKLIKNMTMLMEINPKQLGYSGLAEKPYYENSAITV